MTNFRRKPLVLFGFAQLSLVLSLFIATAAMAGVQTDIAASNGIIHVIDSVVLPN